MSLKNRVLLIVLLILGLGLNINLKAKETIKNNEAISILKMQENSFSEFYNKEEGIKKIKNRVNDLFEGADYKITQIGNTALFLISYKDQEFFTTPDIDYLFFGNKIKLKNNKISKIYTDSSKAAENRKLLRLYTEKDMIVYNPYIEEIGEIFIFVDYSCPFCKKFHDLNLKKLLKYGYKVNYIPFLRNPENKDVSNQMINLFCLSSNQEKKDFMDIAFSNPNSFSSMNIKECNTKEYVHYLLNITNHFNFKGTPVLLLHNGNFVEGYVPFNSLMAELEANK